MYYISMIIEVNSGSIVTQDEKLIKKINWLTLAARSDYPVLLIGETGVGKELFAEFIHSVSLRKNNSLIKITPAIFPENLLESELFGFEKGSFTGAIEQKKGMFELADKGTVFLDDIDDFPIHLQVKLLRVLEANTVSRIGTLKQIPVNFRLISSSKIDLQQCIEDKKFRRDLFYRLNIIPIFIPPLRERIQDIPILVKYFINRYKPENRINVSTKVIEVLQNYSWPGNIRELRNVIQRILIFVGSEITIDDLPQDIFKIREKNHLTDTIFNWENFNLKSYLLETEKDIINKALKCAKGNKTHASKLLGLNLSTFRDKLKNI